MYTLAVPLPCGLPHALHVKNTKRNAFPFMIEKGRSSLTKMLLIAILNHFRSLQNPYLATKSLPVPGIGIFGYSP